MNFSKLILFFFSILAMSFNFAFFVGDIENPFHHNIYVLFSAIVANLIATVLWFGVRTQIGTVILATGFVAVLQLMIAAIVWAYVVHISQVGLTAMSTASIVSLSGGALAANFINIILLIIEINNTHSR